MNNNPEQQKPDIKIPRHALYNHLSGATTRVRVLNYRGNDMFDVLMPPTKVTGEMVLTAHRNKLTFLPDPSKKTNGRQKR